MDSYWKYYILNTNLLIHSVILQAVLINHHTHTYAHKKPKYKNIRPAFKGLFSHNEKAKYQSREYCGVAWNKLMLCSIYVCYCMQLEMLTEHLGVIFNLISYTLMFVCRTSDELLVTRLCCSYNTRFCFLRKHKSDWLCVSLPPGLPVS